MHELQIMVGQEPGRIQFNFDELKAQLEEKMAEYNGAIVTEDSRVIAKKEVANLRKLKEAAETRRKEVKEIHMRPYLEFEGKVKELEGIIDKPIALINRQLDEMEKERVRKRRERVRELYTEIVPEEADAFLKLDRVYNPKWDNKGTSEKVIRESLEALVVDAGNALAVIRGSQSDVEEEAVRIYQETRDLSRALAHINTYEANKRRALEMERKRAAEEEERRRNAEIERARAEERRRLAEIEQAKEAEHQRLAEIERAKEEERRRMAEAETEKKIDLSPSDAVAAEEETPFSVTEEEPFSTTDCELPFSQPHTVTAYYKVIATPEELEQVEMAFNSFGIAFSRRDA